MLGIQNAIIGITANQKIRRVFRFHPIKKEKGSITTPSVAAIDKVEMTFIIVLTFSSMKIVNYW